MEECQNLMLNPVSWLEIILEGLAHPHTARLMFGILQNCTNCSSTRVNTAHIYILSGQTRVSDTRSTYSAQIPSFSPHSTPASLKTPNCFLIPNLEQILGQPAARQQLGAANVRMWNMACRHKFVKKKYKCKYRPVCRWFKFKIQKKDAARNFVENCLANMNCLLCCNNNGKFLKNWGKNFNVNNKQEEAGGRCRLQQAGPGQQGRLSPA